jgi:hypothetical protein
MTPRSETFIRGAPCAAIAGLQIAMIRRSVQRRIAGSAAWRPLRATGRACTPVAMVYSPLGVDRLDCA